MRLFPWKLEMYSLCFVLLFVNFSTAKETPPALPENNCRNDQKEDVSQRLCVKIFREEVPWQEALETCIKEHSFLLQFQSGSTTYNMSSIYVDKSILSAKFVWIGLTRLSKYFQWVGVKPQLFRSVKNQWGLHWKEHTEPDVWNGCGAVNVRTGELHSKACGNKKLPFVCVKPFNDISPLDTDEDEIEDEDEVKDEVDVRIVPIHDKNENLPLPESNILWVNEEDRGNIILDCRVTINGQLMNAKSLDSKIKVFWSKNGIHRQQPIKPSIYPNYWLNPTSWLANIGRIKDFLGTYVCEASISSQTRRHRSNEVSLFIKGTQVFKYEIYTELAKVLKRDCLEPTTSKIFSKWNSIIVNITANILPINKPEVIGASKIEWMLHYLEPDDEIKHSNGSLTKKILISLFVTVETQSKDDEELKQKLLDFAQNFTEYTVVIDTIGKCASSMEFDKYEYYIWSMKLGQHRGFSDPICVSSEPEYKMVSRECITSYEHLNRWEQFNYDQCTSKITHLMEDQFCPEGHKMGNDDFCVVNGSTDSTWQDARDECIRKGSHLPHNANDIYATDQIPETSWSVARLNGRKVYPGPPQNFTGQNWTECVILNRSKEPNWLGAVCTEKQPFFCLSRIQDTLWRVPWCPRGGWLGSEIPVLRNICFFINTSLTPPENMKSVYCAEKGATVTDTSNPLIYILISATFRTQTQIPRRKKRSIQLSDEFVDIPYLVCQKPKGTRSPRKAELVLTHTKTETGTKDKYPIIELICHGINVRPNSRTVWYHNGDPYPKLERMETNDLAAARILLDDASQGDYWCEAWDNTAQSTVSSNKITLIVPGIKNCVILLNTTNSLIRDVFELSKISYYFNKAESNIVRREATLLADGQMVIWVQGNSYRTLDEVVYDVKNQFQAHLDADTVISSSLLPTVRSTEWCLEITADKENPLNWPRTRRNQAALPTQLCLTDEGNAVSRDCLGDFRQGAYWGPIIGSCTGKPNEFTGKLYELSETDITKDKALEASISLDKLTDSKLTKNYIPVDIAYIAKTMKKISDTGNATNETLKNIVDTVDRVMDVDGDKILSSHKISRSSNRITQSLEKMIDSVTLEQGHPLEFSLPNIYVKAYLLAPDDDDMVVGFTSVNKHQSNLTSASQLNYSDTDAALLLPKSLVEAKRKEFGSEGLRMYFLVYHNSKLFTTDNATVNSKVIAASFPGPSVRKQKPPIRLVFKPVQEMSMESVSCTYWDPRLNIGKGDWSTAGCRLHSIQQNRIVCECDHLTNFAVLMDIYGQADRVDGIHRLVLNAITYIGCALSVLGLSLTILTFLLFNKWRKKDGNKIICNLALALLLLIIVFLAGIEQTHSKVICKAVAILLHYFLLSSFCWMLVEAVQQYLLFVRVLATYIPRFLLKAMIFAWGLPLIIVVTVIGIDIDLYEGGHHYCWMKEDALYYSFLLPVGIIMIINAVVFILVLRGITCGRTSNLRSNQSKQQLMKTQIYAAICIFVLLGLTSVSGFVAVGEARLTFQYIFCVCNSLQGLLIFLFMVVRDRNAHDLWSSLCIAKKTKRLGTTSGLQTYTRREEANTSENYTTKLMISRTSQSPSSRIDVNFRTNH